MINDLIYVYCISNTPPGLIDYIESKGLKCIVADDLYVIVKYVSGDEFSEENLKKNIADIQWLETNAREHIMVIGKIMEQNTVIPFNFGTIYQSEESLKKFITDYSGSLAENLLHLEWKEEWAVKIYVNRKALTEQIDELSEEAAALEKQIMASSPGKAFLLKRKKTDLIENEMDRLCKNYGQEYYNEFKNLSVSTCLNNLIPKDFTGREDTMILNATLLVSKDRTIELITVVRNIKNKHTDHGFDMEITGPWPPYSFVSIKENQ